MGGAPLRAAVTRNADRHAGAPPREVPLSETRLAAMLETNRSAFAD